MCKYKSVVFNIAQIKLRDNFTLTTLNKVNNDCKSFEKALCWAGRDLNPTHCGDIHNDPQQISSFLDQVFARYPDVRS